MALAVLALILLAACTTQTGLNDDTVYTPCYVAKTHSIVVAPSLKSTLVNRDTDFDGKRIIFDRITYNEEAICRKGTGEYYSCERPTQTSTPDFVSVFTHYPHPMSPYENDTFDGWYVHNSQYSNTTWKVNFEYSIRCEDQ
jgi:hypothetical protein